MIKTVLVSLSGTGRDAAVLHAASAMFGSSGAHLECVHLKVDPLAAATYAGDISFGTSAAIAEAIEAAKEEGEERSRRAFQSFTSFCKSQDVHRLETPSAQHQMTAAWCEHVGDMTGVLTAMARFHDVLVIAGGAGGQISIDDVGSIVIASGRPVLLVPHSELDRGRRTVAIAWKDTAECARAVTAAMPVLEQAKNVIVLSANENPQHSDQFRQSLDGVVQLLRWHGIPAEGRAVDPGENSSPDVIISAAKRGGADLLVMGAYGHSRLREMIFGGFTEHVLKGADIAVMMAH